MHSSEDCRNRNCHHRFLRAFADSDDLAWRDYRAIAMSLKLRARGEQYAPMVHAIVGGLTSSVLLTIFIVPAAYLLVYGRRKQETAVSQ